MNQNQACARCCALNSYIEALLRREEEIKAIDQESHDRFLGLHYLKAINTAKGNEILLNLRNKFADNGTDTYPYSLNSAADKHKDYTAIVPCHHTQVENETGFAQHGDTKNSKSNNGRTRPTQDDLKKLRECVIIKHPGSETDNGKGHQCFRCGYWNHMAPACLA